VIVTSDFERAVIFKRDPLKGCKKTLGMIVGGEGGKGVGTVGQYLRADSVGAKPGYLGDQMNYVNFELPLADSCGAQIDVVPPQTNHCVEKYRGEATPYCQHRYYHPHPVYLERDMQKGSKIRENVEEVCVML
jgi:hypothetical protein